MVSAIRSSALPPVYAQPSLSPPISPLASSTAALTRARLRLQLVQLRSSVTATNRRFNQFLASRGFTPAVSSVPFATSECDGKVARQVLEEMPHSGNDEIVVECEQVDSVVEVQSLPICAQDASAPLGVVAPASLVASECRDTTRIRSDSVAHLAPEALLPLDVVAFPSFVAQEYRGKSAHHLFDEMRQRALAPDRYTYSTLITSFGKAGMFDSALAWLQKMEQDHVSGDLVMSSNLIELSKKLCDYSKARLLLKEMRGVGVLPDTVSYSTLLSMYIENQKFVEALSVFSEMNEVKCPLDLTTCNVMIDVYGQLDMAKEVDRLFWSMRKMGIEPNVVSYNTLLRRQFSGLKPMLLGAELPIFLLVKATLFSKLELNEKAIQRVDCVNKFHKGIRDKGGTPLQLKLLVYKEVSASRSRTQQKASLNSIISLVKGDFLTVEVLVTEMGMCLTTTDNVIRARGILLLAEVLTGVALKPLNNATIHSLIGFFTDQLAYWRALRGALVGCLALMRRKVNAVSPSDAKAVAQSYMDNLQVQSVGQNDRKLCFELLLSKALMSAFSSTPLFEPFAIPLLLEKLSSSLPLARLIL